MCRGLIKVAVLIVSIVVATILQAQAGSVGRISGHLFDKETLQQVVGASVTVVGTKKGAVSDFDGKFIILRLDPGKYNLKIASLDYQAITLDSVIVVADSTTEIEQYLIRDTTRSDNVITINCRQNIIDKFGSGSPPVISQEQIKARPVTTVDELLELVSGPVPSGSQIFIRNGRENDSFIVDSIPIDSELIDTISTEPRTQQRQSKDGWIRGTLLDEETSEPIVGAYIFTSDIKHSSVSDHDGDFILTNIVPGVQDITISSPEYAMLRIEHIEVVADSTTIVSKRLLKNATPPDTILVELYDHKEIRPKQIGSIQGLLLEEGSDKPVASATLHIESTKLRTSSQGFRATSDFEGSFLIYEIPSGEYTLTISSIGYELVRIEHIRIAADSTTEIRRYLTKIEMKFDRDIKIWQD